MSENKTQTMSKFTNDQIDLLKKTSCSDLTKEELQIFIHACERTGLDPFMRQIYSVKIWNSQLKKKVLSIQTGIDGYRLIADRTGKYAPGLNTEFEYKEDGSILCAKSYVKKMTPDGSWHVIGSEAYWDEYVQRDKEGREIYFWKTKGHIMLSKCAEALALRKAFPAELSGIYTKEEMGQALADEIIEVPEEKLSSEKLEVLTSLFVQLPPERQDKFVKHYKLNSLEDVKAGQFEALKKTLEISLGGIK